MALNPPFNQHRTVVDLTFSGYNTESYFSGYVLWYKEVDVDNDYVVCGYNEEYNKPTLSFVPPVQTTETIMLEELSHQEYGTFDDLIDAEREFKFAVSSYGINVEGKTVESAKVEF